MLQSFAQSQDWLFQEPLFLDDEFCLSLMKDWPESLLTPPQSPPMKAGLDVTATAAAPPATTKPLSKEDQLSYVSDILLEDHDMQLNWTCDFFHHSDAGAAEKDDCDAAPCSPLEDEDDVGADDSLWRCLSNGDKLHLLGTSPLLSDIDTSIFEEIAGSTLDCQNLMEAHRQTSESTSDYGSTGGEMSTCSSSDSEEEIDVVTVGRRPSSPSPTPSLADVSRQKQRQEKKEEEEEHRRALQRHYMEIQLQHNYAAPCPASPPPPAPAPPPSNKRSRGGDGSLHAHHSSSRSSSSSSSSSRYHSHHHHYSSRNSVETEDDEERRRCHNVMERQRRNELKNCFTRLRDNVPEVSHNDKASKVIILKKARDCIYSLEDQSQRLLVKKDKLRARQAALKARLERLRS